MSNIAANMKVGDIVRHKLDGEVVRIKRIGETVATCEQIRQPKEWNMRKQEYEYSIRISLLENLEKL